MRQVDKQQTQEQQSFDIVISGGGLSGALVALSLSSIRKADGQHLSIAIVEASPILKDPSLSFDDRVLALSHGSAQYLKSIGAWQHLDDVAEAIKNIHISDRGHIGKARLNHEEHGVTALGYVVEMSLIGKSLLTEVANKNNVTWFAPDKIEAIEWHKTHVDVSLDSKQLLKATLLLGCDGAQSPCRQFSNIKTTTSDYGQAALITNVSTSLAHQGVAFERFTESGPLAMLPLSSRAIEGAVTNGKATSIKQSHRKKQDNRCSLVWTLEPDQAQALQKLDDDAFALALRSAFGTWLGNIEHVGKRDVYPLKLVQAQEQVFHRMALIGNASHTIHPIAGQGFNLGLRDVQVLAEKLALAIDNQQDIGEFALLSEYEQQRAKDHKAVINLTDSLVTLFSNELMPLVVGRNIGLKALDHFSSIKNRLVKKTMGY